ncbi:MAG: hypothetical protein H7Z39_21075 [Burkholderiaceae bacterium]|nr:hypothetical protein [Burkholderiaceae bacterium]
MIKKLLILAAATATAAMPLRATAQWRAELGPAFCYASVSENKQSGERVVHESGALPGIAAALSHRADRLETFGAARAFRGALDYDGQLQNGIGHQTKTDTRLAQAQLGLRYHYRENTRLIAALEYDDWERNIRGDDVALGLREHTRSRRLLLGAERAWQMAAAGTLIVGATLIKAEPERLDVHFSGLFDDASMRTRAATGYAAELAFRPAAYPKLLLSAKAEYMKVPRSGAVLVRRNGNPAGDITQPEHVRQSISFFLRYVFAD